MTFTPTQQRIFDVLRDGYPHPRRQLLAAIDELATPQNLYVHICAIRKIVQRRGEDIISRVGVQGRTPHYQWVKLIQSEVPVPTAEILG